jgi:ribosomal protein S20
MTFNVMADIIERRLNTYGEFLPSMQPVVDRFLYESSVIHKNKGARHYLLNQS